MSSSRDRAEAMKRRVGRAPYGSERYWVNAARVLGEYVEPGRPVRADTRSKLEALAANGVREAREALERAERRVDEESDYDPEEGYTS